jgi:hypothetical protein
MAGSFSNILIANYVLIQPVHSLSLIPRGFESTRIQPQRVVRAARVSRIRPV